MATLLKHDETVFEDQVVYATGNAFRGCEFHRCTIVFKGFPAYFHTCKFSGCIWHIDVLLHDSDQVAEVNKLLSQMVLESLPKIPEIEQGTNADV